MCLMFAESFSSRIGKQSSYAGTNVEGDTFLRESVGDIIALSRQFDTLSLSLV